MDRPVSYSISEGWTDNNLSVDDLIYFVGVVEFGNATSKVDFTELTIGFDFCIECFGGIMLCTDILSQSIPNALRADK
jgi:hypothetical protein